MKLKIKRYRNRKLYDISKKEYTNLSAIRDAVLDNVPVEVIRYDGVNVTNAALIEILKDCNTSTSDLVYLIKQGA